MPEARFNQTIGWVYKNLNSSADKTEEETGLAKWDEFRSRSEAGARGYEKPRKAERREIR